MRHLQRRPAPRHQTAVGRLALVVTMALLAAGCAGPREKLEVGLKEFPSDVVLGAHKTAEAPVFLPPDALPLVTPIVPAGVGPTHALTPTSLPLPPPPCPSADPLSAPKDPALTSVTQAPVAATYPFRNDGSFEISGANAQKGLLPISSSRTIGNVVDKGKGSFTYDVTSVFNGTTTVTSYRNEPLGTSDAFGPGIYITRITETTGTTTSTFDPTPDLLLLKFPIEVGTSWQTAGVDQTSKVGMAFTGTIHNKARVDACGEFLDGFTVVINGHLGDCQSVASPDPRVPGPQPVCPPDNGGQQVSPTEPSSFGATYVFGTQFGGITLQEHIVTDSQHSGSSDHVDNLATISKVPALPRSS
jgi:hypothetical protein